MDQILKNIGIVTTAFIAFKFFLYAKKFIKQYLLSNNFNFKACGEWAGW